MASKKLIGFCVGVTAGVVITLMSVISHLTRTHSYQPHTTLPDIGGRVRHLSGKAVAFVHDSDSTWEEETRTDNEVEGFSQYLLRCRAEPLTSNLLLKVEPGYFTADGAEWYAHYIPRLQMAWISRDYLPDPDVIDKEYVHLILQQSQPNLKGITTETDSWAIEDALARYLPCSYHNHSRFAVMAEKTLRIPYFVGTEFDNDLTYAQTQRDRGERARFWGGIFWELRQKLSRDPDGDAPIDAILVAAWKSMTREQLESKDAGVQFATSILAQDRDIYESSHHQTAIRAVFAHRRLPGYKE